ncbi:hypothetical protein ANN_07235 [Periplaneta americana]|uniref:Uncharacterized protein n=1 Tax=Periplaneta americana TaxID=6978 RepID=A0ABQ8THV6_PERAM|nr:hypothetical protein ANN_07235 [Periplaneta americana]
MSPGSSTESYPAFAHIGLREYPGKNLNQVTCPDRESNPGHLVSRLDALTVTPQIRPIPNRNECSQKRAKTAQPLAFTERRIDAGFVKDIVYSQKSKNIDDLRVKITQAFQQITPLMLQRTWAELHHCYELCRPTVNWKRIRQKLAYTDSAKWEENIKRKLRKARRSEKRTSRGSWRKARRSEKRTSRGSWTKARRSEKRTSRGSSRGEKQEEVGREHQEEVGEKQDEVRREHQEEVGEKQDEVRREHQEEVGESKQEHQEVGEKKRTSRGSWRKANEVRREHQEEVEKSKTK